MYANKINFQHTPNTTDVILLTSCRLRVFHSVAGISVGCADDYLHDIDCQWIDITDVTAGDYTFQVHINPEYHVAEMSFDNNLAQCDLTYSGSSVQVRNCVIVNKNL